MILRGEVAGGHIKVCGMLRRVVELVASKAPGYTQSRRGRIRGHEVDCIFDSSEDLGLEGVDCIVIGSWNTRVHGLLLQSADQHEDRVYRRVGVFEGWGGYLTGILDLPSGLFDGNEVPENLIDRLQERGKGISLDTARSDFGLWRDMITKVRTCLEPFMETITII